MSDKVIRKIEHVPNEIVVSNLHTVRKKLKQMILDGPQNLIVITGIFYNKNLLDFDGTLTKRFYAGETCHGSFGVLHKVYNSI